LAFSARQFQYETPEERELCLVSALAIMQLHVVYDLPLADEEVSNLCYALCLRPDKEGNLYDFDGVSAHYQRTKRLVRVICF